jgi:hypothetical protein
MMEWEKMGLHRKEFLKLKCLSPLEILTSPLFKETLGAFLSLPLFFWLHLLRTWGFLMIFEEESLHQKLLFKWFLYTGGGRIFRSAVMHTNMAKP